MTTCLICKVDISNLEQQFGDVKHPICQSDYLAGYEWVNDEPVIVDALQRGIEINEAMSLCVKEEMSDLENFARQFFIETNDPLPTK